MTYINVAGPSRQFMIQQAVLNAGAVLFPTSALSGSLPETLRDRNYLTWEDFGLSLMYRQTLIEFRKLVAQYS